MPCPVAVFLDCAFVELFFAFGNGEVDFDVAVFPVKIDGNEGVAVAFGSADELGNFAAVQEEFAGARGIGEDVGGGGRQRRDVGAKKKEFAVFHKNVAFFHLNAACA